MSPEERAELRELRAELRSARELLERYRDGLRARAAERERRRRQLNRLTLGLLGRQ